MNRIRIGRPRARALSPDPQDPDIVRAKGARADRAFPALEPAAGKGP